MMLSAAKPQQRLLAKASLLEWIERSSSMVKYQKQVPEYYKGMYRDGYTPEQILDAIHRKIYR